MLRNCDFLWLTVFTLCLVVAMEREKKGKEEGKGKKNEREEKIFPFDVFEWRKEENVRVLSFLCLACKGENVWFYLCTLINNEKIHILEHL